MKTRVCEENSRACIKSEWGEQKSTLYDLTVSFVSVHDQNYLLASSTWVNEINFPFPLSHIYSLFLHVFFFFFCMCESNPYLTLRIRVFLVEDFSTLCAQKEKTEMSDCVTSTCQASAFPSWKSIVMWSLSTDVTS